MGSVEGKKEQDIPGKEDRIRHYFKGVWSQPIKNCWK